MNELVTARAKESLEWSLRYRRKSPFSNLEAPELVYDLEVEGKLSSLPRYGKTSPGVYELLCGSENGLNAKFFREQKSWSYYNFIPK